MEIEKLIAFLKERKELIDGNFAEFNDMYGEGGVDAMDASGGNFDDAYELGRSHGTDEGEYGIINEILKLIDGGHA